MNDRLREILKELPERRQRSRLAPFEEFIRELRRRGWTYREIARILAEKCDLKVASTTVVRFVHACSKAMRISSNHHTPRSSASKGKSPMVESERSSDDTQIGNRYPSDDEIQRRITAIKERIPTIPSVSQRFHYDPDKPLHIPQKAKPGTAGK